MIDTGMVLCTLLVPEVAMGIGCMLSDGLL